MSHRTASPFDPLAHSVQGRRTRRQLAARLAADIPDGWFVNLGIGMPTAIADVVDPQHEIVFHSENGIIGVGHFAEDAIRNGDLINAGKEPITVVKGAAFVNHSDSFALIRGGHLDLTVMGAFQVAENGDFANWSVPGANAPGVGGAIDLAVGAKRVWIMMNLFDHDGMSKLCERCSYPLTSCGVVERVYTDFAVLEVATTGFVIRELVEGMSLGELQSHIPVDLRWDSKFE